MTREEISAIEGMCCDCIHDKIGFCGDYSENEHCRFRKDDGTCWTDYRSTHKVHEIKTLPEFFQLQVEGLKPFEVRRNDRGYQVGDIFRQKEWTQENGYTGRTLDSKIIYILDDPSYCKDGFVVLGLREVEK